MGPRSSARASVGQLRPILMATAAYGLLAGLAVLVADARRADLLMTPPWLPLPPWAGLGASLAGGGALAAATLGFTRVVEQRSARVRALHRDLRPIVHGTSDGAVAVMALASGFGEELFFRGALVPLAGVVASSVVFGLLHQIRGRGRWVWMGWAMAMGAALACIFQGTGYLAGCIVAHVTINFENLRFLRDHDPSPKRRPLGGLLRRPEV